MRNICQNLNTGIITNKFLTSKMQSRNRLHFVLTKNTPENRSVNCIKIISLRTSHPVKCPTLQGFFLFLLLVRCLCKTFNHYVLIFITIDFIFKLLIHSTSTLCIKSIDFFVKFCYHTFDTQI